jgi:hypothetical protein
LPEIGKEKVWNESTNNWVLEVLPIGIGEFIIRNVISESKICVPCSLVLDVRKRAEGLDVDLDHAEFAFLVE